MKNNNKRQTKLTINDGRTVECGYELKLTSIGNESWQLFMSKLDDSSDYVRVVYGVTEQVGGGPRAFKVLRKYILTFETNSDADFMFQFKAYQMKNRRTWVSFETVKRNKGKRGSGVGTFIALSPVQSKWRSAIGSNTLLEIKPLEFERFSSLYIDDNQLDPSQVFISEGSKEEAVDYKTRLFNARNAYYGKVQNATAEDLDKAITEDRSVADAEADEFIRLDFTDYYNLGYSPDDLSTEGANNYREFLRAFDLKDPKGVKPKKLFNLAYGKVKD